MTVITKEDIENGNYTQDDILDYYDNLYYNNLHRDALKNLGEDQFDEITTYTEGNTTFTVGTLDGVSVIINEKKKSTIPFEFTKPDFTKVKQEASDLIQGVKNFSEGTRFGLVQAYNNTKILLNEASGGRLKQFEDIVNKAGKDFFDIDVKIPIESLRPENETIGTLGGEITGQYIIPGAFVYRYIPNILLAEPVVVGLFSGRDDGNLATAIKELAPNFAQNNEVAKIILDGLSVDADDSEVLARIKNVTADAPIGIVFSGLFSMLKYFKRNPDKLEEVQNEYKDAGAAATPDDLKKNFKSTQPFYSNVVNAIREIDIPEGGMDVTQFTNTIRNTKGIKQSELDDMGFDEFFLDDKPAIVTQERVNEFLETKDLSKNVKTTVLGEDKFDTGLLFKDQNSNIPSALETAKTFEDAKLIIMNDEPLYNQMKEYYKKYIDENNIAFPIAYDDLYGSDLDNLVQKFLDDEFKIGSMGSTPTQTKFDDYVLPGGEDYREMLLTTKGTQIFTKDHFRRTGAQGIPEGENILAHIRFNKRTIDGKKVLFIEEIQSDLHQAGRKQGYVNQDGREVNQNIFGRVPDAPFKKNWHELSMKRIIKYAIDNGFEGISFTPGKVQVERYNLSKQIHSLNAEKIKGGSMDGKYEINIYHGDEGQINKVLSENELEEFIGKDLAKKIVNEASDFPDGKEYSGLDLQVGGEGMIGFYDQILPKFVNKFSKKYGAKLENARLGDEGGVPTYYDDVADAPEIDEAYSPNNKDELIINKLNNGKYVIIKNNEVVIEGGINTVEEAQEKFVETYNILRAKDYEGTIQDVPYLEFTPEMINTIKSEGVPVAALEDRETSATRTV